LKSIIKKSNKNIYKKMKALLFLNLLLSTLSIIPNWNLKNSSKDLLTSNTYTYTITHREMYNLVGKLDKTI